MRYSSNYIIPFWVIFVRLSSLTIVEDGRSRMCQTHYFWGTADSHKSYAYRPSSSIGWHIAAQIEGMLSLANEPSAQPANDHSNAQAISLGADHVLL